jgi:hypothetical protein
MFSFQPWDELLHQYVDEGGLVNYQAWKQSPQKLTNWLQSLSAIAPESLSPDEQIALWLNLYNALTIARVLEKYPIKSILPRFLGIPNWLAFAIFFSRPVYTLNRRRYSLSDIEHNILRQKFDEPRIHFALVCASIGCPLLRNEAYVGDRLEVQLEEDARRFINNFDKVFYDPNEEIIYCSKIFKWYEKDFLEVANSIPEYIQTYLSSDIHLDATTAIKYLDYDWSLNQRIS